MTAQSPRPRGLVKSPLDLGGGVFLLVLGVIGFAGGFNLPTGTLSGIGSGLMPKAVAVLICACGVVLVVQALLLEGDRLEQWHLRGAFYIVGGVVVFALLIRGSTLTFGDFFGIPLLATVKIPQLGLIVAGPLAVIVSAYADRSTRLLEIVAFSVLLTLLCALLFKELLNLPIPFDPAGLIPRPFNDAYAGAKSAISQAFGLVKSLFGR